MKPLPLVLVFFAIANVPAGAAACEFDGFGGPHAFGPWAALARRSQGLSPQAAAEVARQDAEDAEADAPARGAAADRDGDAPAAPRREGDDLPIP